MNTEIKTLIIGFTPLTDTTSKKPRQLRDDTYFKEFLKGFDLGEVHFATYDNWKEIILNLKPLVAIVLGNQYCASQISELKLDTLLYCAQDPGQIFYRKAEVEEKKQKQFKTFTEIASIIKKARDGGEKEISSMRKFAAMSYDDMYKMIIQAIIGEDKNLSKQAWELLMNNDGHSNFVWMRVQLICETWQESDGKQKEEFMCMAMDQHVDNGIARKLDMFTDEDGQEYHQYAFLDFMGYDVNYIRRIPCGTEGQDKYEYDALLKKYETPNGPQVMLEAGQMRTKKKEYLIAESAKIFTVLEKWKKDPQTSKKDLLVDPWEKGTENEPLNEKEIGSLKRFLQKHDREHFESLFPVA